MRANIKSKEEKTERIHYNRCGHKTEHRLIAERIQKDSEKVSDGEYFVSWQDTCTMLECCGCRSITLRWRSCFSEWDDYFIRWYNDEHLHFAIGYYTLSSKEQGLDLDILAMRRDLYRLAREQKPRRWFKGRSRSWNPVTATTLNPNNPRTLEKEFKKSA